MKTRRRFKLISYLGLVLLMASLIIAASPLPSKELKFEPNFFFNGDSPSVSSSWLRASFESIRFTTVKLTFTKVSEPTAIFLMGSVLLGVGIALRKKLLKPKNK
jgi:hypothetical protein